MSFRILSLDGGGVRGAFIAGCLAEWEKQLGAPLIRHFDLVVGTSTGSCIALLLAFGIPMDEIESLYTAKLREVFLPMPPYFSGIYKPIKWTTSPFLELFTGVTTDELVQPKYSSEGLKHIATDYLGDKTLADARHCRVNIPAVDLKGGRPVVFKTPHLPNLYRDKNFSAIEIALAATAAPTYFNPVITKNEGVFCDGALWANNPGMVAYSEAINVASVCNRPCDQKFAPEDVHILSLGAGFPGYQHVPPADGSGVKWWARRAMEIMFSSQSQSVSFYLSKLLGHRFYRVNFQFPDHSWSKLDTLEHAGELSKMGHQAGLEHVENVAHLFFASQTIPYEPYDWAENPSEQKTEY